MNMHTCAQACKEGKSLENGVAPFHQNHVSLRHKDLLLALSVTSRVLP